MIHDTGVTAEHHAGHWLFGLVLGTASLFTPDDVANIHKVIAAPFVGALGTLGSILISWFAKRLTLRYFQPPKNHPLRRRTDHPRRGP